MSSSTPVLIEVDADYLKGLEEYYKTGTNFEYTYHRNAAEQLKLKDELIANLQDDNRDLKDKVRQLLEEAIHLEDLLQQRSSEEPHVKHESEYKFKVRVSRLYYTLQAERAYNRLDTAIVSLTFHPLTKELISAKID